MCAIADAKKSAHNVLKTMENDWTVQQLHDQWKIQQETQLSMKAYNAQVASKNLAMLIETQKSAEVLTVALDALNREQDAFEYREAISGALQGTTTSLYKAAIALQQHHQDSIAQLHNLTANLGLLHVAVPPEMTESDKNFAKQLILLHTDELNPIHGSATRLGAGCTLGTKKLQNAIKAVQNHGKGITGTVDTYNNMVDTLMTMERLVWASEIQLPACLDWQQVISIDPDGLLWEEMSLGSTWVTLWGMTYEAAPVYIRDPRVRNGIKMVLQLDRIVEEEEQLAEEKQNVCDEFAAAFMLIVTLRKKYADSSFSHQMNLQLQQLLADWHHLIPCQHLPDIVLWRLPVTNIMDVVTDDADADESECDSSSIGTGLSANSDDQEDRLNADALTELSNGIQKLTAADDDIGIQLPVSSIEHPVSPRTLWRQSHAPPKDLPSIATLFDTLHNDSPWPHSNSGNQFKIWNVAASALKPAVPPQESIAPLDCICEDFIIPHKELRCLDWNQHLPLCVVTAFILLLGHHYKEHPLNQHIPPHLRPDIRVLDPGSIVLPPDWLL
ncbi:hypothetical protein K439DRAFT_1616576 [Ramaria rubella]|nr:hypothetical protein K439DRAFT_1616576 [Ramaria rubella]